MASFIVLSRDGAPDENTSEKTVFVRDSFAIWALAAPVIWLFWHRLWVHAFVVFCALIVIFSLSQSASFMSAVLPLNLMLGLFVALEGPAWRIASFRYRGYAQKAAVEAEALEDAQIIWAMDHANDLPDKAVSPKLNKAQDSDLIFGGTA